jgi:hypothetical protein
VHIYGLSSKIDLDSVRVSGMHESVRVFDIVCSIKQSHYPTDDDPQEAIRLLWAKKVYLEQLKRRVDETSNIYLILANFTEISPEKPT